MHIINLKSSLKIVFCTTLYAASSRQKTMTGIQEKTFYKVTWDKAHEASLSLFHYKKRNMIK